MNPVQANKTDPMIRYAAMAPKAIWRKAGVVCLHRFSMPVMAAAKGGRTISVLQVMGSKEVRFG